MSYIPTEQLQKARQMDLLTYLQLNEPGELVRISNNNYCTKEHDSLKISNGKWYWFSRGFGGVSALDYLIKVKEMTLPEAVRAIMGEGDLLIYRKEPVDQRTRQILLPERNGNNERAIRYLRDRGIHPAVIQYCLDHKLLYESQKHHNVVFIGQDKKEQTRYAAIRGTIGSYKGEATGSDKHYSFHITDNPSADKLHLFESAIDLMSYATLLRMNGHNWRQEAMLSLAGVFIAKRDSVVPVALQTYLDNHPKIKAIYLHLDNDEVGRGAAAGIMTGLSDKYKIHDEPPACGKDINEQLMMTIGLMPKKREAMIR